MKKNLKYVLILTALAACYFFIGNGLLSLTSPDEVFYAQTAREMAAHHTWMTPILFDEPQFEKPIFIYWLLRTAYLIFGISSFSARFFPALFALIGVLTVYQVSRLLFKDERKAFFSSLVLLSSGLYLGLSKTVFTDMVFSVLILLSLLAFLRGFTDEKRKRGGITLFFVFSALAVLTKGPLGLIIPLMTVVIFLLASRRVHFLLGKETLGGLMIFAVIALPWYVFMEIKYGHAFNHEFFYNDHLRRLMEAEHSGNDTWYFYPLTMIGCMFPWSIFVAVGLFDTIRRLKRNDPAGLFLASWVSVTFAVFQVAHSKLTSYILPIFPALSVIAGNFIYDTLKTPERSRRFRGPAALSWAAIFLMLAGTVVFGRKYSHYLSSPGPLYLLISLLVLWLAVTAFLWARKKAVWVFYSFVVFLPLLMAVVPFIHRDVEPYFSSKQACAYLLDHYQVDRDGYVLCSKNFLRGTRFYTGMKTAVLSGSNFFSSHPVPFLNSDKEIGDFLRRQLTTYAFLKKSALADLKRAGGQGFDYQVLRIFGNQSVVRIHSKQEREPASGRNPPEPDNSPH